MVILCAWLARLINVVVAMNIRENRVSVVVEIGEYNIAIQIAKVLVRIIAIQIVITLFVDIRLKLVQVAIQRLLIIVLLVVLIFQEQKFGTLTVQVALVISLMEELQNVIDQQPKAN